MKSDEEIMEILEAYDLTGSYRDAGELAGCSHHTVAHHVEARGAGRSGETARRDLLIDPFLDKLEEWVETSKGKVRADVAHDKLVALGYQGSERTTRRAVAAAKKASPRPTRLNTAIGYRRSRKNQRRNRGAFGGSPTSGSPPLPLVSALGRDRI